MKCKLFQTIFFFIIIINTQILISVEYDLEIIDDNKYELVDEIGRYRFQPTIINNDGIVGGIFQKKINCHKYTHTLFTDNKGFELVLTGNRTINNKKLYNNDQICSEIINRNYSQISLFNIRKNSINTKSIYQINEIKKYLEEGFSLKAIQLNNSNDILVKSEKTNEHLYILTEKDWKVINLNSLLESKQKILNLKKGNKSVSVINKNGNFAGIIENIDFNEVLKKWCHNGYSAFIYINDELIIIPNVKGYKILEVLYISDDDRLIIQSYNNKTNLECLSSWDKYNGLKIVAEQFRAEHVGSVDHVISTRNQLYYHGKIYNLQDLIKIPNYYSKEYEITHLRVADINAYGEIVGSASIWGGGFNFIAKPK